MCLCSNRRHRSDGGDIYPVPDHVCYAMETMEK